MIDTTIQYGEDLEVNTRDFDPPEQDDTEVNSYGFDWKPKKNIRKLFNFNYSILYLIWKNNWVSN